ncbi:MAG: hypothetical protein K2X07_05860 [Caulobacteraceae bacterium]|nr:hypothetical protein [Caulobacteraceae bacterium]
MKILRIGGTLVAAIAMTMAAAPDPARACSKQHYSDDGRYVGGNLIAQVVGQAELIQLVRVTQKRIVTRSYTLGDWYLQFGDTEMPAGMPEYIDHFVFTLEAVNTFKGELVAEPWLIEDPLRVVGYDFSPLADEASPGLLEERPHPNSLPEWVFERPASQGFAFSPASEGAGLGLGECSPPYFMEVDQLFVALRRSDGRLYPASGAFPLEIEVELSTGGGGRRRETLVMQSLIPVSSPDDPLVANVRRALAGSV